MIINIILGFVIFVGFFYMGMAEDSEKGLGYIMFFGGIVVACVLGMISSNIVTETDEIEKINQENQIKNDKEYVKKVKAENPDANICPFCMSTHVTVGTRGYRITTGFIGSSNTEFKCLNCGRNYGFNDTLWIRAIK